MNTTTTASIVLRHLIPALQAIQRDLLESERDAAAKDVIINHPAEVASSKPRRLLKLTEAAGYLNLSKATLYKMTMTRRIPFYKVGSRTMFSEEQLHTWIKTFEHVPEEPSSGRDRSR